MEPRSISRRPIQRTPPVPAPPRRSAPRPPTEDDRSPGIVTPPRTYQKPPPLERTSESKQENKFYGRDKVQAERVKEIMAARKQADKPSLPVSRPSNSATPPLPASRPPISRNSRRNDQTPPSAPSSPSTIIRDYYSESKTEAPAVPVVNRSTPPSRAPQRVPITTRQPSSASQSLAETIGSKNNSSSASKTDERQLAPYKPVKEKYKAHLIKHLKKLEQDLPVEPSKEEFLTADGYYSWLDKCEEIGQDKRLSSVLISMLELWNTDYRLMNDEHIRKKKEKLKIPVKQNNNSTTVNLVVRVLKAKDLKPGSKGKGRNCFAVIEYPKPDGRPGRYETETKSNTLTPEWIEEVTLTVTNLSTPILVSIYHVKEKTGFLGGGEKQEFLGNVALNVQKLVSETVKSGFTVDWYSLNNKDTGLKEHMKQDVQGDVKIEVEMAGITEEAESPGAESGHEMSEQELDIKRLRNIQSKLISHKVDLKKLYKVLIEAVVQFDLCIPHDQNILEIKIEDLHWSLTEPGSTVLDEFSRVWVIGTVARKMLYLDTVFEKFKQQRVHSRALLASYRSLYESVWKKKTAWLPEYEKPKLLDLLNSIEVECTNQIKKYREYFPFGSMPEKKAKQSISNALKPIILLTRSIDKNEFFLGEFETGKEDVFNSPNQDADDILKPKISELDYKNGSFSFTEKIRGQILERTNEGYMMFSEMSKPLEEVDNIQYHVYKCYKLSQLMVEDLRNDIMFYRDAFIEELDIVPVIATTYSKYLVLELENMANSVKQRRSTKSFISSSANDSSKPGSVASGISNAEDKVPETEEELVSMAFDLMKTVIQLQKMCHEHLKKENIFPVNTASWFAPFVFRWLDVTEAKALEWVENAVNLDNFTMDETSRSKHSSSITDLSTAIFQAFDSLKDAVEGWSDEHALQIFTTRFAQVAFRAIELYSQKMETIGIVPNLGVSGKTWSETVNASGASVQSTVMNWFGYGSGPNVAEKTEKADPTDELRAAQLRKVCVCLSNLEALGNKLRKLYSQMDGKKLSEEAKSWRRQKASEIRRENPDAFQDGKITGVIKVHVHCAENLKARPGFIGKTSPYVIMGTATDDGSNFDELARTRSSSGLNPVWTYQNPVVNHADRDKYRFLMASALQIVSLMEAEELKIKVYHKKESSKLSFLSATASDPVLGEGVIKLNKKDLKENRDSFWVDLQPQGRVLVKLDYSTSGIPGLKRSNDLSHSGYGLGGVEDVDYWFLKMEAAIACSRYSIVRYVVDEMSFVLSPMLNRMIQEVQSQNNAAATDITEQYVDDQMAPVGNFLNDHLAILTNSLSSKYLQYVVYCIYRRSILYPLLNYLHPLPFYTESGGYMGLLSSKQQQLDQKQQKMVKMCSRIMLDFFHADGEENGIDKDLLQNTTGFIPGDPQESKQVGLQLFHGA